MKQEPPQSMRKARLITNQNGFSLVEVILASAVFVLLVAALVGAYIYGQESTALAGNRARAVILAEEGLEAVRNIRDANWANLTAGTRGLVVSNNQWNFSGSSDTTDIFTRQITISSVDANRKIVTSAVAWQQNPTRTGTVALTTRFTNWLLTKKGLAPSLFSTLDLTTANSGHDTSDAIAIATQGSYVYLGRATNPGNEFFVINVANPANPTISGQLALGGDPNDIVVSGNYAYIASSDNSAELTVVDISIPAAPIITATFDLTAANSGSANTDALSVAMGKANYLYLTRKHSGGREFYVFNISTPASPSLVGSVDLNGDINESASQGDYAYVASSDNASEFQIINVANIASPALAGSLDFNEGDTAADGLSIAIGANTAYVGRNGSMGAPEFYVINITTATNPIIISTMDIGSHVLKSLDYSSDWQLVFTANTNPANDDYYSIDVSVPETPALLTSVNLDGVPNKLIYSFSLDKVFMASDSDVQELQIIAP